MLIVSDPESRLRAIGWKDCEARMHHLLRLHYGEKGYRLEAADSPKDSLRAINDYFAGQICAIDRLAVATAGTSFQERVWRELRTIRGGTTSTYRAIAERIDRPRAVRAVGLANGRNPVGIVIPCHRVIGSNGMLTGYGGGIDRKRWLLDHEMRYSD
jgi:methylated-DNA-[protein]-cysteine S-methyltransferase